MMSESARGEGGRVWVPKKPGDKRDPKNIRRVNAGISSKTGIQVRESRSARRGDSRHLKVVYEHHLGIDGKPMVYLDLTHIDARFWIASWKAF